MNKHIIRLRVYHPTYLVCYWHNHNIASEDHNKTGFEYVYNVLKNDPDTMIELVQEFDDICLRCKKLADDASGSVWGKDKSCSSSRNEKIVKDVHEASLEVLKILDLNYGIKISWRNLVELLAVRIPQLNNPMIGGIENQYNYENGLNILRGNGN